MTENYILHQSEIFFLLNAVFLSINQFTGFWLCLPSARPVTWLRSDVAVGALRRCLDVIFAWRQTYRSVSLPFASGNPIVKWSMRLANTAVTESVERCVQLRLEHIGADFSCILTHAVA